MTGRSVRRQPRSAGTRTPRRTTRAARPLAGVLTIHVAGCRARLAAEIRRVARAVLRAAGLRRGRLDVAVLDDATMRREHRRWKRRSGPTDVLAFDLRDRPAPGRVDGQVLVCRDTAAREARRRGTTGRAELLLYVTHGCLHLAGYRDDTPRTFARMHRREDELLRALGVGPVFAAGGGRRGRSAARPRRRAAR